MRYKFDGYNWLVRLEKGEQLIASLTELVKKENIQAAWISGLGAAQQAELGFYKLDDKEYSWKAFDQLLEITGLQGNISWMDGEPKLHIHGNFSDENMQTFGGHVKELTVGGTCELLLHRIYVSKLSRKHDDAVGLPLLDI